MKRSTILAYTAVLLVSLVVAYSTWTSEKKEKPGGKKETATILECQPRDLTSVKLAAKNRAVEFTKNKSAVSGEPYWWVRITTSTVVPQAAKPKADGATPEAQEQEGAKKPPEAAQPAGEKAQKKQAGESGSADSQREGQDKGKEKEGGKGKEMGKEMEKDDKGLAKESPPRIEEFKANKTLAEEMEKLCPFRALRTLGAVGEEKLKEFGLADSEERLALGFEGRTKEFVFGTTSYGHRDRYVLDAATRQVYLVSGQLIQDLTYPKSRFMERALHQFEKDAVRRLQISTPEAQKDLVHVVQQGDQKKEFWASAKSPDTANEQYSNWVSKLWQLSPIDYLPVADAADKACQFPEGSAYVGSMLFFSETKQLGFLKLSKGKDEKGEPEYYGCTETTEAVVKLSKSQVENVLKDLDDIFSKD